MKPHNLMVDPSGRVRLMDFGIARPAQGATTGDGSAQGSPEYMSPEQAVAGRGLIQTYRPDHPVIEALVSGDRDRFLAQEIAARRQAGYPPFGRLAALIVSGRTRAAAEAFARALAQNAPRATKIRVLGPAEAPLVVISGRHRFRLLVKAAREADLQAYLREWLARAPAPKGGVRLTIDVDPYSFL